MTRETLLEKTIHYSLYHVDSNRRLNYFVLGVTRMEEDVYTRIDSCEVQQWFNENKELFNNLYGEQLMQELEILLDEWHEETQKICNIFNKKKTFYQKICGINSHENQYIKEKDKIKIWRDNIEELTIKIEYQFKIMKHKIKTIPQEEWIKIQSSSVTT